MSITRSDNQPTELAISILPQSIFPSALGLEPLLAYEYYIYWERLKKWRTLRNGHRQRYVRRKKDLGVE